MACQAYCDKEIGEAEVLRNEASEKARNPSVDSTTRCVDALKDVFMAFMKYICRHICFIFLFSFWYIDLFNYYIYILLLIS